MRTRQSIHVVTFIGSVLLLLTCCASQSVLASDTQKVALVMKALSNPFFLKMQEGARAYAEKHEIPLEVFGIERETEIERQIGIVENLIAREYGAIVIAPADSKALVPVCHNAVDKGIIVINIDNPLHEGTLREYGISIPFVGSDNKEGAAMVGEYLKRKLKGQGTAFVIEGIRGVENAELRKQGFIDAITTDSDVTLLASKTANWHPDEAFSVVADLLHAHGQVDAIFCANDQMALGALQALDMLGMTGQVWVGGYDNIEEVRLEMRNQRMHATIEQHPELMGEYGVVLAAKALAGQDIPHYMATPLDLITYEAFDKTIGVSLADLQNPFFVDLQTGTRKAAELFGVDLMVVDAANDDARQLVDLQTFIDRPVDVMIVNPTNADTVAPALEIATSAGIQVLTVDRKAAREDLVLSHIASDNIEGGRMAARFIAEQLQERGEVIELEGIPGTSAAHDRGQGFNEVMKQFPDITITAREIGYFDRGKASEAMQRILQQNIPFDAIFAHNDVMILGVLDAFEIEQRPLSGILVGFDAIPEARKAVSGHRITATIAQQPDQMGWQAVKAAVDLLRGDTLAPTIFVDLELVTQ